MRIQLPIAIVFLLFPDAPLGAQQVNDLTEFQAEFTDVAAWSLFGSAVALDGRTAVVGASEFVPLQASGREDVSIYFETATGWVLQAVLTPPPSLTATGFGSDVDIEGDTLVVAAPSFDFAAGVNIGAVFTYVRSGSSWALQSTLTFPGAPAGYEFGTQIALSGNTLLVTAPSDSYKRGVAHVYVRSGGSWVLQASLRPSDSVIGHSFGLSAELDRDTALVSVWDYPNSNPSAAYVFVRQGTTWTEQQRLTVNGNAGIVDLALDGDTAVLAFTFAPAVHVFERTGGLWVPTQVPTDAGTGSTPGQGFGKRSVALSQDLMLIGVGAYSNSTLESGAVSTFVHDPAGGWLERDVVHSTYVAAKTGFGTSVDISGNRAIVGAPAARLGTDGPIGAAYVVGPQTVTFCDTQDGAVSACPCGSPASWEGGCALPSGQSVFLDLVYQQTEPTNKAVAVGMGFPVRAATTAAVLRSQVQSEPVVFGDGLRCLGLPVTVMFSSAVAEAGVSRHQIWHTPSVGNGTFYYQLWFRSRPRSFCDATLGFNTSNGIALTW